MARVAALEILVINKDKKFTSATAKVRSMSETSVEQDRDKSAPLQSEGEAKEASVVV